MTGSTLTRTRSGIDGITLDRWAVKATRPDFTTRNGFRWAFPGEWTTDREYTGADLTEGVCPTRPGDGLSVAKNLAGMAQGGYQPSTVLVVGFNDDDVIAEDSVKLRVVKAFTLEVWDGMSLLRRYGQRADLQRADLQGADLQGADLQGADLQGADLRGADSDGNTVWPYGFDKERLSL